MSILNTLRLKSVKRVRLLSRYHPDEEEAEAVFGAILEHEGIKELNISQNQISKVNPDTLARAVNSMEQVLFIILHYTRVNDISLVIGKPV